MSFSGTRSLGCDRSRRPIFFSRDGEDFVLTRRATPGHIDAKIILTPDQVRDMASLVDDK